MKDFQIKVLIADDDKNLRKVLKVELADKGFEVSETDSGIEALKLLEKEEHDVLLLDLNMPRLNGMEVLKKLKTLEILTEVIILTGHASVTTAVEAMKLGAYEYLTKPFKLEALKALVEKAYEKKKLLNENLLLKTQIKRQTEAQKIVTQSPLMQEILETIKKIAQPAFPVLIYGESGVGKELIARAIHEDSPRSEGPFIPINCGAIPENMLETELFGHEKGAFTGAYSKKLGLLEVAHNGTLFLDEIGELSPQLQGKLLRVIENGSFFRVGGIREVKVQVRFVSATNKDIMKEVGENRFRPDLYYRISALTLHIPPLRERKEDIPLLVECFVQNNPAFKHKRFSPEALNILSEYSWPGNIRELQNVVQRTLILSKKDLIGRSDLSADLKPNHKTFSKRLEDMEREHILKVFKALGGNRGKAAEVLGIDTKTLYRKLLQYGVRE